MISKPGTYPITVEQGQTFDRTFKIKIAGTPLDLTGYSATASIKLRPQDTEGVLTLTSGNGLTLGGTAGTVRVRLTNEQTLTLPVKKMAWSLRLAEPTGDSYPVIAGTFTVKYPGAEL